jgi:putative FmdB family regulatory protein
MPRYVFKCDTCDKTEEVDFPIYALHMAICETCGDTMKRVYTAVPFIGPKEKGFFNNIKKKGKKDGKK